MHRRKTLKFLFLSFYVAVSLLSVKNSNLSDILSRYFYQFLVNDKQPLNSPPKIGIIEISNEDTERYGWPIAYDNYAVLFKKLEKQNHPFIFQTLIFSQLDDSKARIADAIKKYRKISGSNFKLQTPDDLGDASLPEEVEYEILPKILFSNSKALDPELPLLAISFEGIFHTATNYLSNGYSLALSTNTPNNCIQLYLPTESHDLVLPSNLMSFLNSIDENISTSKNAEQPYISGESIKQSEKRVFSEFVCTAHPSLPTHRYLPKRKITTYSFSDLLDGSVSLSNENALILTANVGEKNAGSRYADVGNKIFNEEYKRNQGELLARFFDELDNKLELSFVSFNSRVELLLILGTLLFSMFLMIFEKTKFIVAICSTFIFITLSYSYYKINLEQTINMPSVWTLNLIFSSLFSALLGVFLKFYDAIYYSSLKKQIKLELRNAPTPKDIFSIIKSKTSNLSSFSIDYLDPYEKLYSYINEGNFHSLIKFQNEKPDLSKSHTDSSFQTVKSSEENIIGFFRLKKDDTTLALNADLTRFHIYIENICKDQWIMLFGKCQNKINTYQKQESEKFLSVLSKFLPDSLIKKLNSNTKHDHNFEENLESILVPRPTTIGLLQADIRGFSKLAKIYSDTEMVDYIQKYYENVVDQAQAFAQIKLIGDCIFLFIEEDYSKEKSASDLAFEVALDLSKTTRKLNSKITDKEDINFGIAIHFGQAVIGNLSSTNCIDYTVLGNEVNRVARIEELTKNQNIQELIGKNGIVISKQAKEHFRYYKNDKFNSISLKELDLKIRSFDDVDEIYFATNRWSEKISA